MKKIMICALAVGMFTACSQEETLSTQAPTQISFAGAFVENATRATNDPSTSTASINNFDVWAFMDEPKGVVFNDENVTKNTEGKWATTTTQYWALNHDYYFAALSPMDSKNIGHDITAANKFGLGIVSFTNVDGTEDLLYAATTATTKNITISETTPGPVKLTFNHLLSKVKFSFENGFSNDNAYITVKNIKMIVPKQGRINLAQEDWWSTNQWILHHTEGTTTLDFGNMQVEKLAVGGNTESANERLTIPADASQSYDVTFDVELWYGDVLAYSNTLTTKIEGAELKIGKAYDFTATLTAENIVPENEKLYPIEFEVIKVEEWGTWNDYDKGEDIAMTPSLPAEIKAGETLTLTCDYIINKNTAVAGTLDGGNYTAFAASIPTDNGLIRPADGSTVKNITIDGENRVWDDNGTLRGLRAIYITKGGTYTFDNVKTEDVTYAINVNTTAEVNLNVTNSTLEGWTSYGSSTTATFKNVSFTKNPDAYGQFKPYGETVVEDCTFSSDFTIDFSALVKNIKFKNCKVGDTVITAENLTSLLTVENYDAVKTLVSFE